MYTPTGKGYFSCTGALELGVQMAGVDIIQSLEIDPEATAIMQKNACLFGSNHSILTQDIKTITVAEQPKSDVHFYTYPCTKYSAIADIHGTRTGDDLFLHAFRQFVLEQPEMYVVENVPGMKKFKVVMEAMTTAPGYYVHVFCPVSTTNWLPQRRDRLIIIATKRPFTPSHPVKSNKIPTIKQILEPDAELKITDTVRNRMNGKYRDLPIIIDPENPNAIAPTCIAHYHKDLSTRVVKDKRSPIGVRPFTVREYARLQGYPDSYYFPNKVTSYKHIGNGVPVDMGIWIGKQVIKYFN